MSLTRFLDAFSAFLDMAAAAVVALVANASRGRSVRLAEGEDGAFRLAGATGVAGMPFRLEGDGAVPADVAAALKERQVDLVLDSARFVCGTMELPKGAATFLDGVVRSQIDRLTPWSATEAAYGWTAPEPVADDRIRLTVVATARARIVPLLDRLRACGARGIVVTGRAEGSDALVRVLDQAAGGTPGVARVRRVLVGVLAAAVVSASLATVLADFIGATFDAELDALNTRIADQRRTIMSARDGRGAEGAALRALEQHKRETASAVLVLEALSQVLPDGTYLTEMQIERGNVQLIGVSLEPPALIRLLEQSQRFARATFVAPTTRQSGDAGERFQIEAGIVLPAEVSR